MKSKLSTQNDKSIMDILKHQFYYKRSNPYSQKDKLFLYFFISRERPPLQMMRQLSYLYMNALNKKINC